jgi:hypothetical protein
MRDVAIDVAHARHPLDRRLPAMRAILAFVDVNADRYGPGDLGQKQEMRAGRDAAPAL